MTNKVSSNAWNGYFARVSDKAICQFPNCLKSYNLPASTANYFKHWRNTNTHKKYFSGLLNGHPFDTNDAIDSSQLIILPNSQSSEISLFSDNSKKS